ncbi:monooxygenase [Aspergillus sclerotialis]|uniref:Monooxygenase n=1 Tax=Aspergillus sclerotialis TaxID=2070753 RepID=A0A3A2ZWH3_9EURO|nr:monooxygenase [Aspergillus sclerotialis]
MAPKPPSNNESTDLQLDALIIGAGFSGIYTLHKLRDEMNMNVKIFEARSDIGGTWNNNRYPGARVDSPAPLYGYTLPKVWRDWTWTEKYPGQKELKSYFDHIDRSLDIRKDCIFNSDVNDARFEPKVGRWFVQTRDGKSASAKYLVVAVGFASKSYTPDWPGLDTFRGTIYHSAHWPTAGVNVTGKKVAIIGTGSTGIQIAQEWMKEATETIIFQRSPNLCLPMRQRQLDADQQKVDKTGYNDFFRRCATTFGGLDFEPTPRNTFDDTPEQREAFFEKLYADGGFKLWFNNYQDMLLDAAANRATYGFWARKTRARISDPVKQDQLAPLEPPYPFGTKRPSLEQDFYELCDQRNVHIVDTKRYPVAGLCPEGIRTADGKCHEVDIIAVATGFDAMTGGLKRLGLRDLNGVSLEKRWEDSLSTYLGISISGFPNMFLPYSVQAPTAFSNAHSTIELQGDWISSVIAKMERENVGYITATKEAASGWNDEVNAINNATLMPQAKSWYMGANIPGKPVQALNYLGGLPTYRQRCDAVLTQDFLGFAKA